MEHKAENQRQLTQCSTQVPTSHSERLAPPNAKEGTSELLACLTLVAPSGMSADDRNAWVQVARQTLKGVPADLLKRGCAEARKRCRFASEIVPTIFETVGREWESRKRRAYEDALLERNKDAPRLERPEYVTPEEARRILREVGLSRIGGRA